MDDGQCDMDDQDDQQWGELSGHPGFHEEIVLEDRPSASIDRGVKSLDRKKAVTRVTIPYHDGEPDTKKIVRDDGEDDDNEMEEPFENPLITRQPSISSIGVAGVPTDLQCKIMSKFVLGHDLHEVYSKNQIEQTAMSLSRIAEAMDPDIMEMYSPERINAICGEFGLRPGQSLDLMNGYDFDTYKDRKRAWEIVETENPLLVVGSPPCTYFSILYELCKHNNRMNEDWLRRYDENLRKAIRHVRFCAKIYEHQRSQGRYFVHEHPWLARSWDLDCLKTLEAYPDVQKVRADLCQYGMVAKINGTDGQLGPAMKPTGFLTNSRFIAIELSARCPIIHEHVHLMGGKAKGAAIYPRKLCDSICRGLVAQKEHDSSRRLQTLPMSAIQIQEVHELCSQAAKGMRSDDATTGECISFMNNKPTGDWPKDWVDDVHEPDGHQIDRDIDDKSGEEILNTMISALHRQHGGGGGEVAWDDVTEAELRPELVRAARDVEMKFFKDMGVYTRVPRSEQARTGGKIIKTRWVDVNKGDSSHPNYRSRLVGKEFKTGVDDTLFAATPPLEALRLIVSRAATAVEDQNAGEVVRELMVNDVSRAYFYAKATRCIYIELPEEDVEGAPDEIGRLELSLYGTRDGAVNWQDTLSSHLVEAGFVRGVGHPAVFVHPVRDIWLMVHGDDYLSAAVKSSLDWLEQVLKNHYEIKTTRINHRNKDESEGQVLNRVIRATPKGFELEADVRHAELIIEQLGLLDSKSCPTPGVDDKTDEPEGEELEPLEGSEATNFRGIAARCNYLAVDRPEILFSVKECCREMSKPTARSIRRLKRVGRYLKQVPRAVWEFEWQSQQSVVDIYCDANWAGCKVSRKSTSGGVAMIGLHVIKVWSKTQSVIAKSSAESELYGAIKGACEGLGISSLLRDLGDISCKVRMHLDASAAIGIIERKGLNRVRHIDVDVLWLQQQYARRILPIRKILGTKNPADLMTKNLARTIIDLYLSIMNIRKVQGRADVAQQLHSVKLDQTNVENIGLGRHDKNAVGKSETIGTTGGANNPLEGKPKDNWVTRQNGKWERRHAIPRRALFTPFKVPGGPCKNTQFQYLRMTVGRYVNTGEDFKIIDNWSQPENAHRMLAGLWVGTTTYREAADFLVEGPSISSLQRVEKVEAVNRVVGDNGHFGSHDNFGLTACRHFGSHDNFGPSQFVKRKSMITSVLSGTHEYCSSAVSTAAFPRILHCVKHGKKTWQEEENQIFPKSRRRARGERKTASAVLRPCLRPTFLELQNSFFRRVPGGISSASRGCRRGGLQTFTTLEGTTSTTSCDRHVVLTADKQY